MSVTEAKTFPAPKPTRGTLFLRSFLPWQAIRFLFINVRMTIMISKSHGRYIGPEKPDDG